MLKRLFGIFNKTANSRPEPADPASSQAENLGSPPTLIMRDVHVRDGQTTAIEVRSDGIHLQHEGEATERLIPLSHFGHVDLSAIDEEIRLQIARKITLLLPELAHAKREELLRYVFQVLLLLAEDQLLRVRQMIAEELRSSFDAPPALIKRLAWDQDIEVAAPILEFSPLLTEADMMEIVANSAIPGVLEALSSRKNLPEEVTDAIVRSVASSRVSKEDAAIIQKLLDNKGAHFREDTLELVVEQAPEYEIWHESLLDRPELTQRIINKIARFVSQAMILEMQDRGMISKEIGRNLTYAIASRLQSLGVDRMREAEKLAKEMLTQGTLDAETIMGALESGEREFVICSLAVLSEIPVKTVQKILKSEEAETVVALVWKTGLPMRDAITIQLKLGKIPHTKILYAKEGTAYPLSIGRMQTIVDKLV